MSSIRLYILGALADEGDMHGHQLRQLAEKEHIDEWTDISVGALYGAIKRLHAEGLIDELRVEREGAYPERQVWTITTAGRIALAKLREDGLTRIVIRADPFDLAVSRLDLDRLDEVPAMLQNRLAQLRVLLAQDEVKLDLISRYLTPLELMVMSHKTDRLRADIAWHEKLLSRLPELLDEERTRKAASS
ncbi:PadR family transcriptional regulator [Lysinimonas soli]|uniref:PadR family transcriptional regulator n=1 Tax=Lysinimonas soli TaxID=1074233 RepID=A0ABW0NN29_9MICO